MNELKVTVELCAEDRARLDKIIATLEGKDCAKCAQAVVTYTTAAVAETAQNATKQETKETAPQADEPQETPQETKPSAPSVTKAELQSKVVALCQAGKKDETKAVVNEYAPNVSGIPEDKLAEVMEKLNALEG